MTECKKTLNSAASTLKKNPDRVARLAKMAGFRIVPPSHYATGATKKSLEDAVAKLKGKRGLNGVTGPGAGPFADKIEKVSKLVPRMQKAASEDKSSTSKSVASGVVGSIVGAGTLAGKARDKQADKVAKRSLKQYKGAKNFMKGYGASEKFTRRSWKTVRHANKIGGRVGTVAGAAAGTAAYLGAKKVLEKKAEVSKQTKDRALAASAVTSGATLGGVLTHDAKKSRVSSRLGTKGAYKHMASPSVEGAEKRLANSAKVMRRMGKPLRRAGIKGAIAGGLAGAALGAAHLKKEASDNRHAVTAGAVAGAAGMAVGRKIGRQKATERENVKKVLRTHKLRHALQAKFKRRDFDRWRHDMDSIRNARWQKNKTSYNMSTAHLLTRHNAEKAIARGTKKGGIKGALAGAAIGAGVGAAHRMGHKKEAAYPVRVPQQEFLGKGVVPAGAKDVSPKAVLKRKAGKAGKIALGVAAGAALAGAAKKRFEKQAEEKRKDSNVAGAAIGAGSVAYTARSSKDTVKGLKGLHKQYVHLVGKGHQPGPVDIHMAMKSLDKPIARRAAKAGVKGALAGAVAGAAYDHYRGHKKSAAEKITHNGKTIRKGTVTSAAVKTGALSSVLAAASHRKNPKQMLREAAKSFATGGTVGGTYGVARKGLRTVRGEKSMNPGEFKKLQKQAAEMVVRDGKKYRKGTPTSAATTMAGVNAGMQLAANIQGVNVARRAGIPMSRAAYLTKLPHAAAGGALMGYGYGMIRGHYHKKRGEESLNHEDFKKMKSGLAKKAAELIHHNGEDIRRGTIGSAAGKMALLGATLGGLGGLAGGPAGLVAGAALGAGQAAMTGGLYGVIRGALRAQDGEKSMAPAEFDKLKARLK